MSRRKQRVVNRGLVNITREAEYIIKRAQACDSRVVGLGPLVFFSSQTGDAWVLDPADSLALCLVRDGERQAFSILETGATFRIAWAAQYRIDGEMFTVSMEDGRVRTILGYPTSEIENTIRMGK
jgi:hypothetical protein